MDKAEARDLLLKELRSYRSCVYGDLAERVGTNDVVEVRGPSGAEYTIEVDVVWDSPGTPGKIRVMGSIDDGRLPGAFFPMSDDFIMFPDGTLTSE